MKSIRYTIGGITTFLGLLTAGFFIFITVMICINFISWMDIITDWIDRLKDTICAPLALFLFVVYIFIVFMVIMAIILGIGITAIYLLQAVNGILLVFKKRYRAYFPISIFAAIIGFLIGMSLIVEDTLHVLLGIYFILSSIFFIVAAMVIRSQQDEISPVKEKVINKGRKKGSIPLLIILLIIFFPIGIIYIFRRSWSFK